MMRPPVTSRSVRQQGAALLLMMFIIGLAVTAYVVRSYDAAAMKARQEEKTMKALAEAKEALIAWSVAHPESPGVMPYPDRGGEGYDDGGSDCFNANNKFNRQFLIGMLPIADSKDTNCFSSSLRQGVSGNFQLASSDMQGKYGGRLWYAVSRNLVHNYEFSRITNKEDIPPIINPGLLANNYTNPPFLRKKSKDDPTVGSTPYPWIKVRDGNGHIISDRVAAVIIAPGLPLSGQDRSLNAPPVSAYLDTIEINGNYYSNADYQVDDEDFIQAPENSSFNDRLIYITVDELIVALAKRVAREAKNIEFPANGVIANCIRPGNCNSRDIKFTWLIPQGSVYVTTGQPPVINQSQPKQFRCTRKEIALECDEETELNSRIRLNVPLDDSYLGLMLNKSQNQTSEKIRTVKALIQVVNKNQENQDEVAGSMGPAGLHGILNIDIADVILGNQQPTISDWYFENKWPDYTDINQSPALRKETNCSSEACFTITRKGGEKLENVRLLVTVRKDNVGIGSAKLPSLYEGISDFIAIYWEQ